MVRGNALKWLESYLADRQQYVCYKGIKSETCSVQYGVPQGSVLGPILFILFTNDIPYSIAHGQTVLFATIGNNCMNKLKMTSYVSVTGLGPTNSL